jgi:NAD(P)-dependent dehydrogenase (short-subunit alcohol dehydrogenase family)
VFWSAIERGDLDTLAADTPGSRSDWERLLPALADWRRRHEERSAVAGWRYQDRWHRLPDRPLPPLSGTWLVVGDDGAGLADACAAALEAHGARAVRARQDGEPVRGILSLLALGGHTDRCAGAVEATGRLLREHPGVSLWCLTHGAVSTGADDPVTDPDQARLWGLGQVAALEHPDRWGGLVDLPGTVDDRVLAALCTVLGGAEDQVAIRPGGVHVRRIAAAPPSPAGQPWAPSGTTLVTGGTGALGAHVARWLARQGAPHLVLLSRRGPAAPGAADLAAELRALGSGVTVLAGDAGDRAALAAALDGLPADAPLTAVFHTAGVLDDGLIADLTPQRFAAVDRAKAVAAHHLHELTADRHLSAFVLFSSFAGVVGNTGQANYAAANAYLDALARYRRARGLPATSVAWGAWADGGLAGGAVGERLRRRGLAPMPPERALAALRQALEGGDTCVAVVDVDWPAFGAALTQVRPSPLLAELSPQPPAGPASGAELAARLAECSPAERESLLLDLVRDHAAAVLRHPSADAVAAERPFQQLGFDSLTAMELRNRLATVTGLRLPAALAFDHPSPLALARHLGDRLAPHEPSLPVPAPRRPAATDGDRADGAGTGAAAGGDAPWADDELDTMTAADLVRLALDEADR